IKFWAHTSCRACARASIMRQPLPKVPAAVAQMLDKLVHVAIDSKQPSFCDLVRVAGLDPRQDFIGASLRDLDFRDEDLRGFDFSQADLTGADFRRPNVTGVPFAGANLTGAIGLESFVPPPENKDAVRPTLQPPRHISTYMRTRLSRGNVRKREAIA